MWSNLQRTFDTLSTDPDVRAVILTGKGNKAFTAGLDVCIHQTSLSAPTSYTRSYRIATRSLTQRQVQAAATSFASPANPDPARQAFIWRTHILTIQRTITAIASCLKPVICAFHGYCYGAAIDLGTACDIRLSASNSQFSVKEAAIGLAADLGTLTRLPKVVGNMSWVKEVCLSARAFNAQEAVKVGFLSSEVQGGRDEVVRRAVGIAKEISTLSPVAVQGTKRNIDFSVDHATSEGLEYVSVWNSAMLQGEDMLKAVGSGLQKTSPKFAKL